MKIFNTKVAELLGVTLATLVFLSNPVFAGTTEAKRPISEYLQECPWLGLVTNEITYGPITVSNVNIHDGQKLAFAVPGETLKGALNYKVDSEYLDSLHLYHLVIGIKGEGAQDCITHNLGLWNSRGHGHFTLKAPEKPGLYEVRFFFTEALTCSGARDTWNSGDDKPSAAATIGIIVVE